ncbi:DUF1465 family protein [Chakrabartia godavariana]|nr:DUF1465 family protein [Chakrabartia godavariana]
MEAVAIADTKVTAKVIDALYVEAMVLADDARAYFDTFSREERDRLGPVLRVAFSCESLKVTTRLMHVIAWLLAHRSQRPTGAAEAVDMRGPFRLGGPTETDPDALAALPEGARTRIAASLDLYARVARLEAEMTRVETPTSPARELLDRLSRSL